ncbi:hypothetical protein [Modestobacter sp. DSM 44400]|uniref:hypothetical protein n=1 Tax=Modestobacter sp. DSM 44400 TaxID=1550230 RepID=UPI001C31DDD0|nr:hypothetical protein [Modestobacter sp. DSM 44400]
MATFPESTKSSLNRRLRTHAHTNWPQLADSTVRVRGACACAQGQLADGETPPLCRLRYGGSAARPPPGGFALYLASSGRHEDQILPTGSFTGTPEEALDCAAGLYLAGPTI